jgi:hypothetical protein
MPTTESDRGVEVAAFRDDRRVEAAVVGPSPAKRGCVGSGDAGGLNGAPRCVNWMLAS